MAYNVAMGHSRPIVAVLNALKEFIQQHEEMSHLFTDIQLFPEKYLEYQVKRGLILFRKRLFIPTSSALQLVIEKYHSSPGEDMEEPNTH